MRIGRSLLVALAAMVLAAGTVIAVEDVPEVQRELSQAEALEMDAEDYADQFGVTRKEALRRLKLQATLHHEIDELALLAPDRFAGGWIEHEPEFRAVVAFTGDEQTLADVLSRVPGNVHVRPGADFTLAQLVEGQERLDLTLWETYPELGLDVDVRLGSLRLIGPTELSREALKELEQLAGLPVILEKAPAFTDLHTYGGKLLTKGITDHCTTGFVVRHIPSGDRGVLTAGHCDNALVYHEGFLQWYDLTWKGQFNDSSHDAQWMRHIDHINPDDFFNGDGLVDVTGQVTRANALGDFVCHWGISSAPNGNPPGRSCGTIQSTNFDPGDVCGDNNSGNCQNVWIRVEGPNLACAHGDSGGPLFSGGLAYGILKGGVSLGPKKGECFNLTFMSRDFLADMNLAIATT